MRQRNHYQGHFQSPPYSGAYHSVHGAVAPIRQSVQTGREYPYPDAIQSGVAETSDLPLTRKHNRELLKITASWLADPFPDQLVIQERTVSIVQREMMVSYVETIPVRDIGRVVYIDTPIFAGLQILGKNIAHNLKIKGLRKREAIKAKQVLEGLLLEDQGRVDIPQWLEVEERRDALQEAGQNPELTRNSNQRHQN